MYDVSRESRPKRVMNHGAPAATTATSGSLGVEDAQRTEVDAAALQRPGESRVRCVQDRHRLPPGLRPACGDRVLQRTIGRETRLEGLVVNDRDHLDAARPGAAGGTTTSTVSRRGVVVAPSALTRTPRRSLVGIAAGHLQDPLDRRALRRRPDGDPALLDLEEVGEVRGDSRPPDARRPARRRGSRRTRSSRIPWPTYRSRRTSRVLSTRPGRGAARPTKVARHGSSLSTVNDSTGSSSTVIRHLLTMRVSWKNTPWGVPSRRSPDGSHTQKDEPSTSVTPALPRAAGSPAYDHPLIRSAVPGLGGPQTFSCGRGQGVSDRSGIEAPGEGGGERPVTVVDGEVPGPGQHLGVQRERRAVDVRGGSLRE